MAKLMIGENLFAVEYSIVFSRQQSNIILWPNFVLKTKHLDQSRFQLLVELFRTFLML